MKPCVEEGWGTRMERWGGEKGWESGVGKWGGDERWGRWVRALWLLLSFVRYDIENEGGGWGWIR